MRVLVTGASGLLGSVAARDLASGHEVLAVSRRNGVYLPGVAWEPCDVTDAEAVSRLWDRACPELVLHTAAIASIEECARDPEGADRVNVGATAHLARLSARDGVRMVHVSTDAVFDGVSGPYRETDEPRPQSVYAATKLASEAACLDALSTAIVARVNFYGWSASGSRSLAEFFLGALTAGREVRGFCDVEFTSLYNRDLVELLLAGSAANLSGVFHVGSADRMSKFEFGRALATAFMLDSDLVRPGSVTDLGSEVRRNSHLSMDSSAFVRALGRPMPTIAQGLQRMRKDGDTGYAAQIRAAVDPQYRKGAI